ncbi:MAG TPA: 1-deoxy-D-xylulose-5-phosphate reductoisomerase, partial [Solirubrobacterales bacterium]|nr:1-deoxy-D-xylulose-5-phosphate reductoisomerase [Solirubrobacterales bacterium]
MARRVLILGSTGSIGTQALEIIAGRDDLEAVGLAVGRDWQTAVAQAKGFSVGTIAVADEASAAEAASSFDGTVLSGEASAREFIGATSPDIVLNGIVGAAGLGPTIAALSEGIEVALANKESLVV